MITWRARRVRAVWRCLRMLVPRSHAAVFGAIHARGGWVRGGESLSGPGSSLAATQTLRRELSVLIERLDVRVLLDVPCGDFHWMQHVDLRGASYVGGDVVPALVERNRALHAQAGREFRVLDLCRDALPAADLLLCRDALVHLPLRDARQALVNMARAEIAFVLVTHFPGLGRNVDGPLGPWRALDLERPPFDLPAPRALIEELRDPTGRFPPKCLGLWARADLARL